jgi:hypothetical protein
VKLKLLVGTLLFLIVLNLATIGSFLYSQWRQGSRYEAPPVAHPGDRRGERARHTHRIAPENREELRRLLGQLHEETADLREQINELETEAVGLLERDPVPRDSLDRIVEQIAGLRLEVNRRALDKLIESKVHLDPQQQRIFFRMVLGSRPDRHTGLDHKPRQMHRNGSGQKRRSGRI